jgi:hypothetical protein
MDDARVISLDGAKQSIDQSSWRFFEVRLKDGSRRVVKPGLKDPLFLRAQFAAGLGGARALSYGASGPSHSP